ncbi:MAG: hypothetical protein IPL33_07625 [Sphingobacteriales bacterium]|nr:hypothetical protein [Sphingobacteriales bacterium]MCC7222168.1 hypothetical protein [Chitinophagales bacterium]
MPHDSRDTFRNGFTAGIAFPVIFYYLFKGGGWLLSILTTLPDGWSFSDKLAVSVGIVANILPFQFFARHEFGYAMRGIVTATFVLIFGAMYYFRGEFFQ